MSDDKPKDRTTFGNRFSQGLLKGILSVSVPLLNKRILPFSWESIGGIVGSKDLGDRVLIECVNGFIEIKIITTSIWRVRISKSKLSKDHFSYTAVEPSIKSTLKFIKQYGFLQIKENRNVSGNKSIIVKVNEGDSTIRFERVDGSLITEDLKSVAWSKRGDWGKITRGSANKEYHTGFGEKTGNLFKNGRKLTFWNMDPTGYNTRGDPLYQSEPLQVTVREDGTAYGIYYDNPHYSVIKINDSEKNSKIEYYTEAEPLCYYLFAGPSLKEVSEQIATLNGKLPLPPRWLLGYHQCRWSYYPEEQVREIAQKFREKEIPCDSIHLDIDYMDGFRCFTWDSERFPDPKKMTSDLRKDGFKLIVMTDPGLKVDPDWDIYSECIKNDYQCNLPNGKPYKGTVWPGKCIFPDFTNQETRQWWGTLYKRYLDIGIEGFWLDMAEPSIFSLRRTAPNNVQHHLEGRGGNHRDAHNIYGNLFARATREGLDKLRGNKRTFIFARTAFSGIQRYAATWTGDNFSTWGSLQQSIPMVLSMGLSGQPFVSVDLGGFSFNVTPELLIRWYQTGIFYPYCRNHSASGTSHQEPWVFGEEVEKKIKEIIEFRYKLIPYLYSVLWESVNTGLPMMRPLFMEFPKDKETYREKWHNTQFMMGEKLLIAPVLQKGNGENSIISKEIYLPKGVWYDYWSKEVLTGGKVITRDVPIDHLPLFIRAGTALPLGPIVPYVEKTTEYPVTIAIYPSIEITGKAYFDDGMTKDFLQKKYCYLNIRGNDSAKNMSLEILKEGLLDYMPTTNNVLIIQIYTTKTPTKILLSDHNVAQDANTEKYYWRRVNKNLIEIVATKPEFPLDLEVNY